MTPYLVIGGVGNFVPFGLVYSCNGVFYPCYASLQLQRFFNLYEYASVKWQLALRTYVKAHQKKGYVIVAGWVSGEFLLE
jgi:hypothetical protein